MKKIFLLLVILNLYYHQIFSQNNLAIDSLVKQYVICRIDTQKANILVALAGEYLKSGLHDSAFTYGSRALALSQKINFKLGIANSYRRIGFSYRSKSDFKKAIEYFEQALKINKELNLKYRMKEEYFNIAACYRYQEMNAQAMENFNAALAISKEMNYSLGIAESLIQMGSLYSSQGETKQGLENHLKALEITNSIKDTSLIANTLIRIGNLYSKLHLIKNALDCFNKAILLYEKKKDKEGLRLAFNCIALMHQNNNNLKEALLYHQRCLSLSEELGDNTWVRGCMGNIGNIYSKQHNYSKALDYHFKALKIAKELNNSLDWSFMCVANDYFLQKQFKEAKQFNDSAIATNKKQHNGNEEMELLASQIDSAMGNGDGAYIHYKKYIILRDKLKSDEVIKAATKEKYQNDYEKKKINDKAAQDKKDLIAKEEIQRQKTVRNSFIGGFAFVLILVIVVLRNYRQKQKINKKLEEKNIEIEEKNKDILDSIRYARRIQASLLPTEKYIDRILNDKKDNKKV